jgi:hypothetical protein
MKHLLMLILAAYTVHYSIRGAAHNITILAQTSQEARQTVQRLFPDAVIEGDWKNP